jgi:hypothetical protein
MTRLRGNATNGEDSACAWPLQSVGEPCRVVRLIGKNLEQKLKNLVELKASADIL